MSEAMNIEQLLEIIDHSEAAILHEYVTDVNAVDVARCEGGSCDECFTAIASCVPTFQGGECSRRR